MSKMLLRGLLENGDIRLDRELSSRLKGMRLELEVDWRRYAEVKPGSVTVFLLPKDGNISGGILYLLQEKKVVADLGFDKNGMLKKVTRRPLDEEIV